MNYGQSVNYIHSLLKFGIKPGLERMNELLNLIGNPQNQLKFIHVAGTNGKGSTCNMMSNVLINAKYNVGLFTSPYVVDFCERMQFNGEMISHDELAEIVTFIKPYVTLLSENGVELTEFEVITAMAFYWFKMKKCDIVVLEVGLGGRLDSTNVIPKALIEIITTISFDHTNILGNTIEEIAAEKAGIIKNNSVCVSYINQNPKALNVIKSKCEETLSELIIPSKPQIIDVSINGNTFVYNDIEYKTKLIGEHQIYNALSVIEAADELRYQGLNISYNNVFNGIYNTTVPARMEFINSKVLIDGGHNEQCSLALQSVIKKFLSDKKIVCIIGMMADKDVKSYISNVLPHCNCVYTVTPDNPRSMTNQQLAQLSLEFCNNVKAVSFSKAIELLNNNFSQDTIILLCGSFYLASDLRKFIK